MTILLGLDVGTTTLSVVALDLPAGDILLSQTYKNDAAHDPAAARAAVADVIRAFLIIADRACIRI